MAIIFQSLHSLFAMDEQHIRVVLAACLILFFVGTVFFLSLSKPKPLSDTFPNVASYCRFFYVSFLKPHTGDGNGCQQDALESFYKFQVCLVIQRVHQVFTYF